MVRNIWDPHIFYDIGKRKVYTRIDPKVKKNSDAEHGREEECLEGRRRGEGRWYQEF